MKAVLMSIRPNGCKLICSGMKTLEVRKTRPKLEAPFKVYIYCTNQYSWIMNFSKTGRQKMNGKIIGEFTCEKIEEVGIPYPAYQNELDVRFTQNSCLSYMQLHRYASSGKTKDDLFFWHISNVKIYDKPRELDEFSRFVFFGMGRSDCACGNWHCENYEPSESYMIPPTCKINGCSIYRPPQSWCYVEGGK